MENKPELFVYWLKGFFELSKEETLTVEQVKIIKDHLDLVLTKKTGIHNLDNHITYSNPYISNPPFMFPGTICRTCGVQTSNEGGACPKCIMKERSLIYNVPTHLSC